MKIKKKKKSTTTLLIVIHSLDALPVKSNRMPGRLQLIS